jgi:catechol 2,3-dioxygenase-like lactoylglutathione lyase family enzyme
MDFLRVRLTAPARALPALADFYGAQLGLARVEETNALVAVTAGVTRLEFLSTAADPFYHFALLAPGDRVRELLDRANERPERLPDPDRGDVVFDFPNWRARACYFHDPAGNIVELIAHEGVGETSRTGSFVAGELLGFSELGLVGDTAAMADLLRRKIGLELWDGTVAAEGRLAFVGERAKTLILCPAGRPWLPTGRPAEAHPVDVVLSGPPQAEALLPSCGSRIRRRSSSSVNGPTTPRGSSRSAATR